MLLLELALLRRIDGLTHWWTLLLFLAWCAAEGALLEATLLREPALLLTRLHLRRRAALLRLEAHIVYD